MIKTIISLLLISLSMEAYEIKQTPIVFGEKRIELTREYIKSHYGLDVKDIKIIPKIILIHYTAVEGFEDSLSRFKSETLPTDRPDIIKAGALNVSYSFYG